MLHSRVETLFTYFVGFFGHFFNTQAGIYAAGRNYIFIHNFLSLKSGYWVMLNLWCYLFGFVFPVWIQSQEHQEEEGQHCGVGWRSQGVTKEEAEGKPVVINSLKWVVLTFITEWKQSGTAACKLVTKKSNDDDYLCSIQRKEWTWDESKMLIMHDPIYRYANSVHHINTE